MFLSFVKYISGYLQVQVTGYAPERFLNLCSNHNILMWDLKRIPEGYEFCISVRGFRELKPFLKKTRTRVRILKRFGFPFQMFRYRKRKLFFIGIILFFLCLFQLSRFIWNIEIVGNTSVTDSAMIAYLTEKDCGFGTKKSQIDCSDLEEQIRMDYSNIIWTSAQISGTKLTIQVKENLVIEDDDSKEDDTPQDLVADKDAVIERIITRNGVPQVVAGDTVEKGDILVSGRIEILDDAGTVVNYQYTKADADILGFTTYEYSDRFAMTYQKKEATGNSTKRYALAIGEKRFDIPWRGATYALYDKTTDYRQLNLFSDFYLPLTLCVDTYTEYGMQTVKYTKAEAENVAKAHLNTYLKKFDEKKIQILEKNVMIDIDRKYCSVDGEIQTCELIGALAPTERLSVDTEGTDELE